MKNRRIKKGYITVVLCVAMGMVVLLCRDSQARVENVEAQVTDITKSQIAVQCSSPVAFEQGQELEITYSGGMMVFIIGTFRVARVEAASLVLDILTISASPSVGMNVQVVGNIEENGEVVNSLFSTDYQKKKPVDVGAIQSRLSQLGYEPGDSNGTLNKETESAIRQFQNDHSLPVDGKVTHELHSRLTAEVNSFDRYLKKKEATRGTHQDTVTTTAAQSTGSQTHDIQEKSDFGDAFDNF